MTIGRTLLANVEKDKRTRITGWIHNKRKHKNLTFIELRDYSATIQVVIEEEVRSQNESYIAVTGILKNRDMHQINHDITFGDVEFVAEKIEILSESLTPPFDIDNTVSEDLKIQYRYLYMRSKKGAERIRFRSSLIRSIRNFMENNGFIDVHTPIITCPSPEGARDFLIPSRLHEGKFYAMPQSPQIFKQLLMVGGIDKYYQIAPCFRDEDARSDRCFGEFYQLDVEITEPTQEKIFEFMIELVTYILKKYKPTKLINVHYMKYNDAIEKYGTDKPNLNIPLEIEDFTEYFSTTDMKLFRDKIEQGYVVKGIRSICSVPESILKSFNFPIAYAEKIGGEVKGPIAKFINFSFDKTIFFICDKKDVALKKCNNIIQKLAAYENCTDNFEIIIVKDFPMFEYEDGKWNFCHNPFSMPQDENFSEENLESIRAYQYDLVLNGYELLSGSLRNYKADLLINAFRVCGYDTEEVKDKFRCMINAFSYGVPPHGGFALGIERLLMILQDCEHIRDVVPFPLNTNGQCPLTGAPISIDNKTLSELALSKIA